MAQADGQQHSGEDHKIDLQGEPHEEDAEPERGHIAEHPGSGHSRADASVPWGVAIHAIAPGRAIAPGSGHRLGSGVGRFFANASPAGELPDRVLLGLGPQVRSAGGARNIPTGTFHLEWCCAWAARVRRALGGRPASGRRIG